MRCILHGHQPVEHQTKDGGTVVFCRVCNNTLAHEPRTIVVEGDERTDRTTFCVSPGNGG